MAPKKVTLAFCLLGAFLAAAAGYRYSHAAITCTGAAAYSAKPIFIPEAAVPNIMLLFSNDHTNFYAGYGTASYDDSKDYYGYFDPKKEYSYANSYFSPVGKMTNGHRITPNSGRWSGNWLNWATMCHADFVRKALTGGRRHIDSSSKTVLERGDVPTDGTSGHEWTRTTSSSGYYTPFSGSQTFRNRENKLIRVTNGAWEEKLVRVEVCADSSPVKPEENCNYYENGKVWKPEGLLQKFRDKVRFGLMTYTYNDATTDQGGVVRVNVKDISEEFNPTGGTIANSEGIAGFINGFTQKAWDPVAELFYEAIRYFKGQGIGPTSDFCVKSPDGGFQVICNQGGTKFDWKDPVSSWCQKNFIIIINDEYPSKDGDKVPGSYYLGSLNDALPIDSQYWANRIGGYEGITNTSRAIGQVYKGTIDNSCGNHTIPHLGQVRGICPKEAGEQGTFYSGALAYYAHTTDLRSDLADSQVLTTYAIAFRASPTGYVIPPPPMNQLYLATKYGGFDDLNQNGIPDAGEWEGDTENGYVWPRNFAHAESGKDFEEAMLKILNDILRKSSSGTAASVVTSSEGGEGQIYQAYFEPSRKNSAGTEEVTWIGFLQALWLDAWGNLREDTVADGELVLTQDMIVEIRYDDAQNKTVVDKYSDCNGDGSHDAKIDTNCNGIDDEAGQQGPVAKLTVGLSDISPIWEASKRLSQKAAADRVIKTFVDKNLDSVVDAGTADVADSGEFINFTVANKNAISPFLGGVISDDLENVINYIRGTDVTGWRNRVLTNSGVSRKYVLGDIIDSTPTPVGPPLDNYDLIYGDKTYLEYYNTYKNRATYVIAGANDGMLHAFYGGRFRTGDRTGTAEVESAWLEVETGKTLGEEAWAYIPKNVLPHLKWLTCKTYPHVYYVDLKPKIFDARIFNTDPNGSDAWNNSNAIHPRGWGTILVGGMRFGGPQVTVEADFDGEGGNEETTHYFKSAYFAIDITELDNPRLLWEKTFDEMGYTFSYPAIMRLQSGNETPTNVSYANQKWVLVLGNGPNDFNGDPSGPGHVYIVDLLTGNLLRSVAVPPSQSTTTPVVDYPEFMGPPVTVDLNTDYDSDVIYIGSTIKTGESTYAGKMYRIYADSTDSGTTPNFSPDDWSQSVLIDVGKPITAPPGVSQVKDNIWVYFGTGRYIGMQDKTSTSLNSFYGIEDPCGFAFATCDSATSGGASVSEAANLLNVTNFQVYDTGLVTGLASGNTWTALTNAFSSASNHGWVLDLSQPSGLPSERVVSKPAISGGLVLFPSFFPNSDVCGFSGNSRLYSLYYTTGTAWKRSTIGTVAVDVQGQTINKILSYVSIGVGLPSQIAIHVGSEEGGKLIIQMSTSAIFEKDYTPAMPIRNGFIYWREMPN